MIDISKVTGQPAHRGAHGSTLCSLHLRWLHWHKILPLDPVRRSFNNVLCKCHHVHLGERRANFCCLVTKALCLYVTTQLCASEKRRAAQHRREILNQSSLTFVPSDEARQGFTLPRPFSHCVGNLRGLVRGMHQATTHQPLCVGWKDTLWQQEKLHTDLTTTAVLRMFTCKSSMWRKQSSSPTLSL